MSNLFYRRYILGLLLVILAFNYVDRSVLSIVLQDIKGDLALSDTELGLLTGMAFALFYSVMGIPIARWADRGNRVTVISVTTALWSLMVALCGVAGSFIQLLLIRIGVAVGEAGAIPPAHSLIADYFSRAERPRAVAIYMLGGSLSVVIGYFGGGWLNEYYGWRLTFILLGLPGVVLALLAWCTLREPRKEKPPQTEAEDQPPLRQVISTLWRLPSFRHLLIAFSVMFFFGQGVGQWAPSFFIRSHGMSTGELGTWYALIYGLLGAVGTYWGGELASRYAAGREMLQLRSICLLYVLFTFLSLWTYLTPDKAVALSLMGVTALTVNGVSGPMFAIIQTLVPEQMRATAIAFIYLVANLIGMGLGPLAAGLLSDLFTPYYGGEALRYALVALCPGYLWMAAHFWLAARTVETDIAKIDTAASTEDLTATSASGKSARRLLKNVG